MTRIDPALRRVLEQHLAAQGSSLASLCGRAEALLLFGSRAAGCSGADSDWDLMCVGDARTQRAQRLDLVWVTPGRLSSASWQRGELAGHVARWGMLLWGAAPWLDAVRARWFSPGVGVAAAARKRRLINGQVSGLSRVWAHLDTTHRHDQFTALRRELQRFDALSRGQPVSPTAHLDRAWQRQESRGQWTALASAAGLGRDQVELLWQAEAPPQR